MDFNAFRSYWPLCNDMFWSRSDQAFLHGNFGAQARRFRRKSFCTPLRQSEDRRSISINMAKSKNLSLTCPFRVVWTSVSYQNFLSIKSLLTWKRKTVLLLKVLSNAPERMGKSVPFTYGSPIWISLKFPNSWNANWLNSFFLKTASPFQARKFSNVKIQKARQLSRAFLLF